MHDVSCRYCGRGDCGCTYQMTVCLLDENHEVIQEFNPDPVTLDPDCDDCSWRQVHGHRVHDNGYSLNSDCTCTHIHALSPDPLPLANVNFSFSMAFNHIKAFSELMLQPALTYLSFQLQNTNAFVFNKLYC